MEASNTAAHACRGPIQEKLNGTAAAAGLLPVRVDTNVRWERPAIVDGAQRRPPPMPTTLKVAVGGLSAGVDYTLYMFDDVRKVPVRRFNEEGRGRAAKSWAIRGGEGGEHVVTVAIMSDQQALFRAVRADAL